MLPAALLATGCRSHAGWPDVTGCRHCGDGVPITHWLAGCCRVPALLATGCRHTLAGRMLLGAGAVGDGVPVPLAGRILPGTDDACGRTAAAPLVHRILCNELAGKLRNRSFHCKMYNGMVDFARKLVLTASLIARNAIE